MEPLHADVTSFRRFFANKHLVATQADKSAVFMLAEKKPAGLAKEAGRRVKRKRGDAREKCQRATLKGRQCTFSQCTVQAVKTAARRASTWPACSLSPCKIGLGALKCQEGPQSCWFSFGFCRKRHLLRSDKLRFPRNGACHRMKCVLQRCIADRGVSHR